jgi:hypothetical protein
MAKVGSETLRIAKGRAEQVVSGQNSLDISTGTEPRAAKGSPQKLTVDAQEFDVVVKREGAHKVVELRHDNEVVAKGKTGNGDDVVQWR